MGTENDRWRCIGIVLQAISCEGLIFFLFATKSLTINVPVVYMGRYEVVLRGVTINVPVVYMGQYKVVLRGD